MIRSDRKKPLQNNYKLPNIATRPDRDEIEKALGDFEYLMANYTQIVDKQGNTVPWVWNEFQREFARTLMPLIHPETRLNRKHYVVLVKPRQVGASVFVTAFNNLLAAYTERINNLGILHVLPVKGTISTLARDKIEPILQGVHPTFFPTIYKNEKDGVLSYEYDNIKGQERNNVYSLVSSNSQAIRGTTKQVVLLDEFQSYKKPDELEAALLPIVPSYGFSLVVYLSTFETDKIENNAFLEKIQTALENPEDYTLIFVPWYRIYPEAPLRVGINYKDLQLTDYDKEVILPEFERVHFPEKRWGDALDWYHRTAAGLKRIRQEYPTTLDELLECSKRTTVFESNDLGWQKDHIYPKTCYRLTEDITTKRPELVKTDISPVAVYVPPQLRHKYTLCVDPIVAIGDDTDNFAAHMIDTQTNVQCAVIHGRGIPLEEWAQYAVGLCKIYNNAMINPETNVGGEFVAFVRALNYYNFYYDSPTNRAKRVPGIRTTVQSKDRMIRRLGLMLSTHNLILHDQLTLTELEKFEFIRKQRSDGTMLTRMTAPKGLHDDLVMALAMYAGMTGDNMLTGKKRSEFSVI